jgi:hypothetical protein
MPGGKTWNAKLSTSCIGQKSAQIHDPIIAPVLHFYQLWQPGYPSVERLRSTVLRPGLSTGLPLSDSLMKCSKDLFFNLVN